MLKTYLLIIGLATVFAFAVLNCASTQKKAEQETNTTGEEAPILLKDVKPAYPPDALAAGITGTVWVKTRVDTLGNVVEAMVIIDKGKNVDIFKQSALDAARQSKWKPARSNGKPIETWITHRVDFNMK